MPLDDTYTKALLHMNGVHASGTFTDESGKAWTRGDDPYIFQPKFGGGHIFFDGVDDWIDTPAHADFNVGSGDFTVELWVMRGSSNDFRRLFGQIDSVSNLNTIGVFGQIDASNHVQAGIFQGTTQYSITGTIAITADNTWHHVALVRNGNTMALYIDGVQDGTLDVTGITANSSIYKFSIGRLGELNDTYDFVGNIDEFRFSKGVARYTGNFTPPSSEFTVDANTSILLHFNTQGTTITDETGKTWTANGGAHQRTAKFGGACGYFDGVAWIDTPDHDDFNVGSGDWTVDFWFRTTEIGKYLFGQCDSAITPTTISLYGWINSTTGVARIGLYSGSNFYIAESAAAVNDNAWHHYAGVRSGNNLYVAIDGVLSSPTDVTGVAANNSANKFSVGRIGESTSANYVGWMDEFRFSKGIARWTSNFTPPTQEYGPNGNMFLVF